MSESEPDYGVDAPAVMRSLTLAGLAGVTGGLAAAVAAKRPLLRGSALMLATGAAIPLGLGLAMRGYAQGGKLKVRDWMLDRYAWRGDECVLDLGAGRGLLAIGAAQRLTSGRVIALDCWRDEDLSDNGPEALAGNADGLGVADRIEILTADATRMPIPDASADLVLSLLCIHNIEPANQRDVALAEIARVLKPGGRAVIGDYVGVKAYAARLSDLGLDVTGPTSLVRLARSLMWVVEARKPGDEQ